MPEASVKLLRRKAENEAYEPVRDVTGKVKVFDSRQRARTYARRGMLATGWEYVIYWSDDGLPRIEKVLPVPPPENH